jgi:hypothetical protein
MITKGIVQVDNAALGFATKGDVVYITTANALTTTAASNTKFGVSSRSSATGARSRRARSASTSTRRTPSRSRRRGKEQST